MRFWIVGGLCLIVRPLIDGMEGPYIFSALLTSDRVIGKLEMNPAYNLFKTGLCWGSGTGVY
jgi:hypothetical protein